MFNVCHAEKRSSILLLRLVRFSAQQTLFQLGFSVFRNENDNAPASERFSTLFWPAFIQFDLFFSTYVYSRSCIIIIDFITIITLLRFGLMYNLIGYNKKFWKQKLQCRDKTQGTIHFTKGRLGEASCFSDRNSRRILVVKTVGFI